MKTQRRIAFLLTAATLTLSLLGCAPAATPAPADTPAPEPSPVLPTPTLQTAPPPGRPDDAPSTPLTVSLSMPKAPKVGEVVEVTMEVKAYRDAPGTTASILLPPGAQLLEGETTWQGDVTVDAPVRLAVTIAFPQAGEYAIEGKALAVINADMTWGDLEAIYLTVKQDSGAFGYESGGGAGLSASPVPGGQR
jgi:hypothetical protein